MANTIDVQTIASDIVASNEPLNSMDAGSIYQVQMHAKIDKTVDVKFEKVDTGIKLQIVDSMPSSPDSNTLYFVLEGQ